LREAGDLLARYGGEEFVALLPGAPGGAAATTAERLRAAVAGLQVPCLPAGSSISCSIGVHTAWPGRKGSAQGLVAGADEALYAAKALGRNRVCVFAEAAPVAQERPADRPGRCSPASTGGPG
jgi:diguanylate cyclase (GGDEF)-like protein